MVTALFEEVLGPFLYRFLVYFFCEDRSFSWGRVVFFTLFPFFSLVAWFVVVKMKHSFLIESSFT